MKRKIKITKLKLVSLRCHNELICRLKGLFKLRVIVSTSFRSHIRLGWKCLTQTNTLAYDSMPLFTAAIKIDHTGHNVIKLFTVVIYEFL